MFENIKKSIKESWDYYVDLCSRMYDHNMF